MNEYLFVDMFNSPSNLKFETNLRKVLKRINNDNQDLIEEVISLHKASSPFFIRYFEYFSDEFYFYIVIEFCEVKYIQNCFLKQNRVLKCVLCLKKGDLDGVIKTHREQNTKIEHGKIKKWCIEIWEGLDFLHSKQIVHFDIKPANILLEQLDRVKIGDLGLARDFDRIKEELQKDFVSLGCTPSYASPQMSTGSDINEKADIW
jgi:serine/threonine protein kinase